MSDLAQKRHLDEIIDVTGEDRAHRGGGEVIDLAQEDDAKAAAEQRRKKRKSERRQRELREFEEYLHTMSPRDQAAVRTSLGRITDSKLEVMRRREEYLKSGNNLSQNVRNFLDSAILHLEQHEDNVKRKRLSIDQVKSEYAHAERKVTGLRHFLNEHQRNLSMARTAGTLVNSDLNMLRNDRIFQEGQSNSMVTAASASTNALYRPVHVSDGANMDVLRQALDNRAAPGLLPDGSYIPSDLVRKYRETGEIPPELVTEYRNTEYLHHVTQRDTQNFENLVELALNEAEPLDFPPQLQCSNLEHQRQGLGWLLRAERGHNKGGILADDMGLGKTVQTIALFYANPSPHQSLSPPALDVNGNRQNRSNDYRMILIVCPVSLFNTWEEELKNRVKPGSRFRVYRHHSSNKRRIKSTKLLQQSADVVLCSYNGLTTEYKKIENFNKKRDALIQAGDFPAAARLNRNALNTPLFDIKWHRVVLDEAHTIKNKMSQASIAAVYLDSKYRLALTGTPMQNKLEELYPLVRFLHIEPHQNWSAFQKLLPPKGSASYRRFESQKSLAAFLTATLLRRKKDTVINGRKIIDSLPPKHNRRVITQMDGDEMTKYVSLEKRIQDEFKKEPGKNGNAMSTIEDQMTMSNMLVYMLRLRQASCHPLLTQITKKSQFRLFWGRNEETKKAIHIAMTLNPIFRRLAVNTSDTERVCYICDGPASQMAETNILTGCGHVVCSECSPQLMDSGEGGTCTCGVSSRDLANLEILFVIENDQPRNMNECMDMLLSYQGPRKEAQQRSAENRLRGLQNLQEEAEQKEYLQSWADSQHNIFVDDSDATDPGSPDPRSSDPDLTDPGSPIADQKCASVDMVDLTEAPKLEGSVDLHEADQKPESLGSPDVKETPPQAETSYPVKSEIDPLEQKIDINEVAKLFKVANIFDNGWVSSAKVESCLSVLREIWRESIDDKVIIFSSFTSFIDVLTIPLVSAMIPYEEYTGRMGIQDRDEALDRFKNGRCKLLLTSLKAGNVGLTLTQANRVIIMEPFWNPYIEDQAQDRVYRIGQAREVTIYQLYVKDTVEDRIGKLQDKKREIIESALDNSTKTRTSGLSRSDIMFALGLRR